MSEYLPEPSSDEVQAVIQGLELHTAHHALLREVGKMIDLDEGLDRIYLDATREDMGLDEI